MYQQQKIEQAIKNKNQRIDSFVDRKEKSIAFMNANNGAVEMCRLSFNKEKCIRKWRDWFYNEWMDWHMDTIIPMKDKPFQVSAAKRKRIIEDLKAQDTEEHFKQDEDLKQQKVESEYFKQPPE